MRRIWRWLAGVAAVFAVAVGVLLLPPVQRMLLRRLLASCGASDIEVGYFHAMPFRLVAGRIRFSQGPLRVDARGLDLAIGRRALLHRRLELVRGSAENIDVTWNLDAGGGRDGGGAAASSGAPPPGSRPFSGFLRMLRLPFPLSVDAVDLAGRVTLLHGAAPFAEARWHLGGGGIAPGKSGSLAYRLDVSAPAQAPAQAAHLEGSLVATEGPSGEMTGLTLRGGVGVRGGALESWGTSFEFGAASAGTGESYHARASFGPDLKAEFNGSFSAEEQRLRAHADFSAAPSVDSRYSSIKGLGIAPSSMTASLDATFRTDGASWSVIRAVAALRGGPAGAAVQLDLAQPWTLASRPGSQAMASLRIEHLPLAGANRWLSPAGIHLDPCEMAAAWGIGISGDTVVFTPTEPLTVGPIHLTGPQLPPIGTLRLQASPRIEISRAKARIVVPDFRLESGSGERIDAAADAALDWIGAPSVAVNAFALSARPGAAAAPFLSLKLLHPLRIDPANVLAGLTDRGSEDLIGVTARDLPLGWISRLLPGRAVAGTIASGASLLRITPDRGLVLTTTTPWRATGLRLTEGGRDCLHGLGPLQLSVTGDARVFSAGRVDLSRLGLDLATEQGAKLFSISAQQPITVARAEGSEWLVSSPQPLRFTTGAWPLARLNPLLASRRIAIGGVIPPTELHLWFSPRHVRLESKAPLAVAGFHLERDGRILLDRALLRFGIALDLDVEHRLLPVFQMKSSAVLRVADGVAEAQGSRVARFDGQLRVTANEHGGSPRDLSGSLWLDLGALGRMPVLAGAGLPPKGELTMSFKKSQTKLQSVEFSGKLDRVVGRDGAPVPALILTGRGGGDVDRRLGGFGVRATLMSSPRPSDLHFGIQVDFRKLSLLDVSSRLEGSYVDVDAVRKFAAAFAPGTSVAPAPPANVAADEKGQASDKVDAAFRRVPLTKRSREAASTFGRGPTPSSLPGGPPWGGVRGHFVLAIKTVVLQPYTIENLGGRFDVTAVSVALSGLSGDLLGGKWSADISTRYRKGDPAGEEAFDSRFRVVQFDAGSAARMRFPNPSAGLAGRLDLDVTLSSRANRWDDLLPHAAGRFALVGHGGLIRLTIPKQEMISNGLIVGGTVTFSSELRALGRLVRRLSEVPIDRLEASGTLTPDGQLHLEQMRLESPELRLAATGKVDNAKSRDLLGQPLSVQATLAASGDLAVILRGMHLLNPAAADGYGLMNRPFLIAGTIGQPDFHPLYDLLAQAVGNSHGTWGMLMRTVQAEVDKRQLHP